LFGGPDALLVAKGAAVGLLVLYVLTCSRTLNHLILGAALIASTIGDILLLVPASDAFLCGLTAFAAAHLIYITLYLRGRPPLYQASSLRVRLTALIWVATLLTIFWVYPLAEPPLKLPVVIYGILLATMASMAVLSRYPLHLTGLGAIFFLLSDAALAIQHFVGAPAYMGYFIWAAYYTGQLLMVHGVMKPAGTVPMRGGYRFD